MIQLMKSYICKQLTPLPPAGASFKANHYYNHYSKSYSHTLQQTC